MSAFFQRLLISIFLSPLPALNNYQNLINANRFGLSMIDQEIAQLDPPFHHWLSQIDEETHHLFGKREMLAKSE